MRKLSKLTDTVDSDRLLPVDKIKRTLGNFGLNDNEILVYLQALREDDLGPFKLSRLTGIPRTTVYETLMSLSLKGLVTLEQSDGFTKQQTKVKAKNPSVLRDIIWEKRKKLSTLDVDIVDILPGLKTDFHRLEANADFEFYPGIEGAKKTYFGEPAEINLPIHAFENLMPMDAFGKESINQDVSRATRVRKRLGAETKEIIVLNDWTRHVVTYQSARDKDYFKVRQFRYIDQPGLFIHQRIFIQGQMVKITTVSGNEAWGLSINSLSLAQTLDSIFQVVWQSATPLTAKAIASWGINEFFEAEKGKK